jgi:YbbR domain-containing protein
MRKKLTHNIGLKIISALFAIILWLIVVNIIDPVESKTFNNIQVTVENEDVIISQGKVYDIIDNSDTISVSLKGRRSVLEKLRSTDFLAVADMKEMIVADIVPIEVTVTKFSDKIEEPIPKTKTLKISIDDSATEQFGINTTITGTPGNGYAVGNISCNPSVLKVTGAASVVNKISKVAVGVDVAGMTATINTSATPKFYDSDGDVIESTSLEYKTTDISVSIDLLKTKDIQLDFGFKGTPADDYQCVDTVCSPDKITIAGEEDELAKIDSIIIPDIDVTDATANVQQIIDITSYIPNTVRLVDSSDSSVLVTAIMEKKVTQNIEITMNSIELQNVPSKYTINYANNDNIMISVKGLAEVVNVLNATNIKASVDLSNIKEAGTKTVPVTVTLTEGTDAVIDGEVTINVVVTRNNSGTSNGSDTRP